MKEKATGMTMKKLTMIVMVLVLLLAEGCQNSDHKLRKLQQQRHHFLQLAPCTDAGGDTGLCCGT